MATALATEPSPQSSARDAGRHDRLFYGGMAIAMGLTVFAGFASTYYLRFFAGGPRATLTGGPFTALVHVHAALFTAWVLLFIVQTALILGLQGSLDCRSCSWWWPGSTTTSRGGGCTKSICGAERSSWPLCHCVWPSRAPAPGGRAELLTR